MSIRPLGSLASPPFLHSPIPAFPFPVPRSVQNGGLGDVITIAGTASPGSEGKTNISINSNTAQGSITATGTISADHTTLTGQYQASVLGENATANGTFTGTLCPGTT